MAASTDSDSAETHARYAVPFTPCPRRRTTLAGSQGHSAAAAHSSATASQVQRSPANRVPSTAVETTVVNAAGVSASWRHRALSYRSRAANAAASTSHIAQASTRNTAEASTAPSEAVPSESTPVAITAAPADGGSPCRNRRPRSNTPPVPAIRPGSPPRHGTPAGTRRSARRIHRAAHPGRAASGGPGRTVPNH